MNRIIKTAVIAAIAGIGMVAVGGTAMADAPDGTYDLAPVASDHASAVGKASSQIKQNGQFVSGRYDAETHQANAEWQNQAGSRAAQVQEMLGH